VTSRAPHVAVALCGDAKALIVVAGEVGPEELNALSTTVAALAHEAPEIVVDLTGVSGLPSGGARLLLRLGALARGAGGHLRARCPAGARPTEVVELDIERAPALARLGGPVGCAFEELRQ
jgi:ABC-type transporter Mla MlaB component